jgi:hypothetical protein
MRRVGWLVVATVFLVLVPLSAPAGAAADIILKFDDIQGESVHDCTDVFCTPTVSEYIYTGAGSCMQNCVGLPVGQAVTTLTFSISRLAKDGCTAKAGTGTLDVQWPDDLAAPSTQGTFTFKAKDSKTLTLSGQVTTSTVAVLYPPVPIRGKVGFPPSPCVGGATSATLAFTG